MKELARMTTGKSVLLLSDKGVRESGITGRVAALCVSAASSLHECTDIPPEPSEDQITDIVARIGGKNVSVIVAVGGGSVMDTAKVASVMLSGGPKPADMFEGTLPERRAARLIMLPTTAGTGSEATPNAIIFRPSRNLKVGIVCDAFIPDHVILDPELTIGLPAPITASTGLDALCHALECYVSNKANALSDFFAVEAVRLIFKSLKRCHTHSNDLEARGEMLLAAFYAGICIASSGTNAVHALSYPLGGRYRIAHGVSNAVLLAPVFAANKDACVSKLAGIAHLTGKSVEGLTEAAKADVLVKALAELSKDLGIPGTLTELGIPPEDLDSIVDAALEVKRLLDNNPKVLSRDDIRRIYISIL
jgi:alcohol dehydrogenase class IV